MCPQPGAVRALYSLQNARIRTSGARGQGPSTGAAEGSEGAQHLTERYALVPQYPAADPKGGGRPVPFFYNNRQKDSHNADLCRVTPCPR